MLRPYVLDRLTHSRRALVPEPRLVERDRRYPGRDIRMPMEPITEDSPARVGLVLSGGGLRGASHVGVLQALVEHDVQIDVIVGASAGAVIAAYYAAVGLTIDELLRDAATFKGRHLLAHSLNVRVCGRRARALRERSGLIPERLEQLERATFDRLHHNVRGIGVVCHDLVSRRPCYFATGEDRGIRLSDVVRASASIPFLLPPVRVESSNESTTLLLTDGGVSDCLPVAFAQRPPLSATHLIVSDCRWFARRAPQSTARLVYVRPRLPSTGIFWAPASTLMSAAGEGRGAVTAEMLRTIRGWPRSVIPRS
jgi:predicted acylesterase/phospholipase RssA